MSDRPPPREHEAGPPPARPPFRSSASPADSAATPVSGLPARPGPPVRPGATPGGISRPGLTATPGARTPGVPRAVAAPPAGRLIGAHAGPGGSAQKGVSPVRVLIVDDSVLMRQA